MWGNMAQTVLQQVLILSAMMMLGFLLGKLGKVDRKGGRSPFHAAAGRVFPLQRARCGER